MNVSWYSASLLFEGIRRGSSAEQNLWEESVILIQACTPEEAESAAGELAEKAEISYETASDDVVDWKFRGISAIYQIQVDDFSTGTEVFSRFLRATEAQSLLSAFD